MVLKSKIPLHKRIFLYTLTLLGLYMLCFVLFQYNREKEYKVNMLNYKLQVINTRVGDALQSRLDIDSLVPTLCSNYISQLRITIIDSDGVVVFDSHPEKELSSFNNHANRQEVVAAIENGMGYTVRRLSESTNQEYFYSATKIDDMIVRSAIPYSVSLREVLSADKRFLWFMIGVAIMISLFGYMITRQLGDNIEKLRKFALSTARGEQVESIDDFANDELGVISAQVVSLYNELKSTKERLEGEHELVITHEHEKAKIKKQLTQNINHELKTPVSSIRGYLEILIDNPALDREKRDDFIAKSYIQVERLTKLLADISTITRMEEASEMVIKARVDLISIIGDALTEAQTQIEQQGVIVASNIKDTPFYMMGNQSLLHSIFANLIDNALAYSGCSKIEINLMEISDHYRVRISDNGCGIEEKHLSRIFERFYRVDKGRSRKIGGTGLGLSIVKNAVIMHGGTISAQPRVGGGTSFIFTLNKDIVSS